MAKIIDGTPVDAATTNAALLGRQADDTATGIIGLSNMDPTSGPALTNIQREMNSAESFSGNVINQPYNSKPSYSNNQGFSVNEDLRTRTDGVSGKFHNSTGHKHTGNPGDGPQIQSGDIATVYLKSYITQGVNLTTVSGATFDVSTPLTGATASNSSATKGIVVNAPYNRVALRDGSDNEILDGSGNEVYARITNSGSTWTLTFYSEVVGVETPYTLPSTPTVKWYYIQLISPIADSGFEYANAFFIPSQNATADVVDASASQRGLVNITAQTLAGKKYFQDGIKIGTSLEIPESVDSTTTGSGASLATTAVLVKVTSGSLVSINNISSPSNGKSFILINGTGVSVDIINNSGGTAANRIRTGTGANLSMANGSSLIFSYDSNSSLWQIVGGSGAGGAAFDTLFSIKNFADPTKIAKFDASGISTGTTRTFTFPDADTTLLGTNATQIITNKDIDAGTASNTHRITVAKDTYANLVALARKAGTIVFATDKNIYYGDNGTSLNPLGSGTITDVTAQYGIGTSNLSISSGSDIIWPTTNFDPTSSYNASNGRFTAPYTGKYLVILGEVNSSNTNYYSVYVNGVRVNTVVFILNSGYVEFGSTEINLIAGDYFTIRPSTNDTLAYSAGNYSALVSVALLSAPIQLAGAKGLLYVSYDQDPSNYWHNNTGGGVYSDYSPIGTISAPTIIRNTGFATPTLPSSSRAGLTFVAPVSGTIEVDFEIGHNANAVGIQSDYQLWESSTSTELGRAVGFINGDVSWMPLSGFLDVIAGNSYDVVARVCTNGNSYIGSNTSQIAGAPALVVKIKYVV